MQKISILISSIDYGNMEEYIVSLSNVLYKNYDITIVSAYEIKPVYIIERGIKVLYLKKDLRLENIDNLLSKHKYIKYIKRLIKNIKTKKEEKKLMINYIENNDSDTIISTNSKYSLWLTKYGRKNIKKIGINNDDFTSKKIDKVIKCYKNLDYFISLTEEQDKFFKNYFENIIYLPIFLEHKILSKSNLENKRILFIGDLNKDVYNLIDIFKKVSNKHNDWYLDIIGKGSCYKDLKETINKEKLNIAIYKLDDIDMQRVYLNSSIYISYNKDVFSLSLLKALSYGIPSLAFLDKMGSNKLIKDNYDGYIVKYSDKDKMIRRINELIENKNRRIVMGMNAYKKNTYDKNIIKETLEKIL